MAIAFSDELMSAVRARFAHVEECPFAGERVFFENAGGALTLNSVAQTSAKFAAIPDNQGRANAASAALVEDDRDSEGGHGADDECAGAGSSSWARAARSSCSG